MLALLFRAGAEHYALETGRVVEVLPLVRLKRMPRVAEGVAGVLDYHGAPVPVLDVTELMTNEKAAAVMDTRIAVVRYGAAAGGNLLGLILEGVTGVRRLAEDAFAPSGIDTPDAPWLGSVVAQSEGLLQRVDVDALVPDRLRAVLFQAAERAG